MAKAVLISTRPEWVKKILAGEKTLEVRKNRPNMETPFKVYIYCTAGNLSYEVNNGMFCNISGGRLVVGEFVCDKITWLTHIGFSGLPGIRLVAMKDRYTIDDSFDFSESCLTTPQIEKYLGGKDGYVWHISDLKIYDTPKELTEFRTWKKCKSCSKSGYESTACIYDENCMVPAAITKAPQSWQYVEELK